MKCFYHSADLDGHCSAAIVKHFHPECELIGINYGDPFPWHLIADSERVFMVDFSLQPIEEMVKLNSLCHLFWIDHHKSAIEAAAAFDSEIDGLRDSAFAACELTWECFADASIKPLAVTLLGRYDVWDHSNPHTLPFQYGIRLNDTDPGLFPGCMKILWKPLLSTEKLPLHPHGETNAISILEEGRVVLKYVKQDNAKYCRAAAFETMFDGKRCIAVNKLLTSSQLFDSVWDPEKYDAMITFGWRNRKWTVSLYSTKPDVDVSVICKAHGGGGHKGAAGFQCAELPFAITVRGPSAIIFPILLG
jgi:uncharacterized protein